MENGTKLIQSTYGLPVVVGHVHTRLSNSIHVVELTASCGESNEKKTLTFGADSGERLDPPTTEHLQALVDKHRGEVANSAAWKDKVRLALDGVV